MGILCFPLHLLISILSLIFVNDVVHGKCWEDQRLALLEFRQNISWFRDYELNVSKPWLWNSSTDCCSWAGVTCEDGLVVGLDLGSEAISGDLDDSSSLFELLHLRSLNLSCVNFSTAIPSAIGKLENLMNLDLSESGFFGQIPMEIFRLTKLSVIELSGNKFSSLVPKFSANFSNLISLGLGACNLVGKFPEEIFWIPSLQTLDLSNNNLFGPIPNSFANMSQLVHLNLSFNIFTGPIPNSFANLSQLVYLDLSYNNFIGPIPVPCFEGLEKLVWVRLSNNLFSGSIPSSLFNLSSLQEILLSHNHFDGLLPKFSNASSSQLDTLDLGSNFLQGPIPMSFFDLRKLREFSLSSNNLSGTIELIAFQKIANLTTLDLSYNSLSIKTSSNKSSFSKAFCWLSSLKLASCKLKTFPDFRNQSRLSYIDFSDNQIGGDIPSWIWDLNLDYLNLSHNLLVNLQKPFGIPTTLLVLDLNSNDLHGEIPILPEHASYVDYSSNHFSSSIPVDYFSGSIFLFLFSVSSNNLTGSIPESICNAAFFDFHVLDLSQNNLSGTIPSCLVERNNIAVLNLAENKLVGKYFWNISKLL